MKLVRLTDEGDKPIVVNADTVCFLRRYAPDRVEIHFVGETSTKVKGTVEFVKIARSRACCPFQAVDHRSPPSMPRRVLLVRIEPLRSSARTSGKRTHNPERGRRWRVSTAGTISGDSFVFATNRVLLNDRNYTM